MVYKFHNAAVPNWTYDDFGARTTPSPYDCFAGACLEEITSPDGVSVFLLKTSNHTLDADPGIHYGIEAPRNCPMRQAFEWGEISYLDYWFHKGWLLKIKCPWNPGILETSYITPDQMDSETFEFFKSLKGQYPYDLKRQVLELRCAHAKAGTAKSAAAERAYREFMAMYGHRFAKLVA